MVILSSALIRRGRSVNYARITALLICALGILPVFATPLMPSVWPAVALVTLAAAAHCGYAAMIGTDGAGPRVVRTRNIRTTTMNPRPITPLAAVLERRRPARVPYAPNYWQWFVHQRNHGLLPAGIAHCQSQLELIHWLGLDVFSRNAYCDEQRGWFGGLAEPVMHGVECVETELRDQKDRVIERTWHTAKGSLTERTRYLFAESTLVQERFPVTCIPGELPALYALLAGRRWRFKADEYARWQAAAGDTGLINAGELYSPLKMLHLVMGSVETAYLLDDEPELAAELVALHEEAMLDLVGQMARAGVKVLMAMDNLDSAFHSPAHLERCSASFYERAARICHDHGSLFFIHACGHQRAILPLIASLGVDGLEGVAFPPLGNVALDEAMRLSGERLIITGGISAAEFGRLQTRAQVFDYTADLFRRMEPFANRFILSASCATPYNAPWNAILHFRDAWREFAVYP